jgi:hypothetical protein
LGRIREGGSDRRRSGWECRSELCGMVTHNGAVPVGWGYDQHHMNGPVRSELLDDSIAFRVELPLDFLESPDPGLNFVEDDAAPREETRVDRPANGERTFEFDTPPDSDHADETFDDSGVRGVVDHRPALVVELHPEVGTEHGAGARADSRTH